MDEVTDFDLKDCRLAEVPIASWGGFVFIRYTGDGLSLANTLGDLPDVFRDYASPDFRCVRRREFVVRSNWKFLIENALEAYHTGTVHRASLGRQQSEVLDTQGHWLGLRVFVEGRTRYQCCPIRPAYFRTSRFAGRPTNQYLFHERHALHAIRLRTGRYMVAIF